MKRLILAALLVLPSASFAQGLTNGLELSFYTGYQDAPHSRVSGFDPGGLGEYSFLADWEGKSFSPPPYYGLRATWWKEGNWGWGVEFNHAKIYATDETKAANAVEHLEFTDGLNIFTLNYAKRWPEKWGRFTPYVIGGVAFSMPHVEMTTAGGRTFGYQVTGPAVAAVAGLGYQFNDRWGAFGEYKFTYSQNEADLDNGGTLNTDVITNALNVGVSFNF